MYPPSSKSLLFCLHRSQETGLNWVLFGVFRTKLEPPGMLLKHVMAEAQGRVALPMSRTRWCGEGKGEGLQPLGTGVGGRGSGRATFRLSVTFLFISLLLSPQWQVGRIYWDCITETRGSQNLEAPRSTSCTARCRAETRTAPPSLERWLRYGLTYFKGAPAAVLGMERWAQKQKQRAGGKAPAVAWTGYGQRIRVEGTRNGCILNVFQTWS